MPRSLFRGRRTTVLRGASDTSYFLLSLMDPTFALPSPWRHVSYHQLLRALDEVDPHDFGSDEVLVDRYRALVRRLVELKDAVDPRQNLDGPFSVHSALGALQHEELRWPAPTHETHRTRAARGGEAWSSGTAQGRLEPRQRVTHLHPRPEFTRCIGWQLQESQLRLFVLVRDRGLAGKGDDRAALRAQVAEHEYASFADHAAVEAILGDLLEPKSFEPGVWQKFAPDFVYRYRKVHPGQRPAYWRMRWQH